MYWFYKRQRAFRIIAQMQYFCNMSCSYQVYYKAPACRHIAKAMKHSRQFTLLGCLHYYSQVIIKKKTYRFSLFKNPWCWNLEEVEGEVEICNTSAYNSNVCEVIHYCDSKKNPKKEGSLSQKRQLHLMGLRSTPDGDFKWLVN